MSDVSLAPVEEVVLEEIEFIHLVCCNDHDLVICGTPIAGEYTSDPANCLMCLDLAHKGICPTGKMCTGLRPHEGN